VHFFDLRVPGDGRVYDLGGAGGGGAPRAAVTAVAFHAEDSYVMFGGAAGGAVVAWDVRREAPLAEARAAHAGPVLALAVGGSAAAGFDLYSAGDDGAARRRTLAGGVGGGGGGGNCEPPSAFDASGDELAAASDAALTGIAWLSTAEQRTQGRGDGVLVASAANGAVEWATVLGGRP